MTSVAPNHSAYRRLKRRTFEIMEGEVPDKYSHFVEIFIALLVVANVIGIILESVPEIHDAYLHEFHTFDVFSVAVFSVEFILRVWSYSEKYAHQGGSAWQGRKEYLFSFYGIIDFVSTVPFSCSCCSQALTCVCCVCSVCCGSLSSRATTAPLKTWWLL